MLFLSSHSPTHAVQLGRAETIVDGSLDGRGIVGVRSPIAPNCGSLTLTKLPVSADAEAAAMAAPVGDKNPSAGQYHSARCLKSARRRIPAWPSLLANLAPKSDYVADPAREQDFVSIYELPSDIRPREFLSYKFSSLPHPLR